MTTRIILTVIACCFFTGRLAAQKKIIRNQSQTIEITMPGAPPTHSFAGVRVFDLRFDTPIIGVTIEKLKEKFTLLKAKDGLQQGLTGCFSLMPAATPLAADSLLVMIRELWQDEFSPAQKEGGMNMNKTIIKRLHIVAELYAGAADNWRLLKRVDTFINTLELPVTKLGALTGGFFTSLAAGLQVPATNASTKKLSLEQALKFSSRPLLPHAVLAVRTPKKGAYMSYNEFLNNSPSIPEFKSVLIKGTRRPVAADSTAMLLDRCWGYYDDKYLYCNIINYGFFRLHRLQNQFYRIDTFSPDAEAGALPFITAVAVASEVSKSSHINRLNLATGQLY
jgi:hypothetical protein